MRRFIPYRWRELFWQLRDGRPTEEDIYLFANLESVPGLVLDVGANRGQFALSLLKVNHSLDILSLEANRELRWILSFLRLLHPRRFRFRLVGAGARDETLTLHIPVTSAMDLSANASLDPQEFGKDYVQRRLQNYSKQEQGRYRFKQRQARIVPVDNLGLAPLAIKIDVEGFELPALRGMESTLERHHPLLLIEMNNQQLFMPWLEQRGYRFYRYHHSDRCLRPLNKGERTLNVVGLHQQTPAIIWQRLVDSGND